MDPYSLKAIADQKIAEDREWAARSRLAVEADRPGARLGSPSGRCWPDCSGRLRVRSDSAVPCCQRAPRFR